MLKDTLKNDLKQAMLNKDNIKKNTIQLLRAGILQKEKDLNRNLKEEEIEAILVSEKKKRIEALGQFEKANRQDLFEQTEKEIRCIEYYLPEQASINDITEEVISTINKMNATKKDMGKVISSVKDKFKNRADGKTISDVVKKQLGL